MHNCRLAPPVAHETRVSRDQLLVLTSQFGVRRREEGWGGDMSLGKERSKTYNTGTDVVTTTKRKDKESVFFSDITPPSHPPMYVKHT